MADSLKDRRTKYTRNEIRRTYIEMLGEMPARSITVSALCSRVGMSRGTFYLHYPDILAVEEDVEDTLIAQSKQITDSVLSGAMIGHENENYNTLRASSSFKIFSFEGSPTSRLNKTVFDDAVQKLLDILRDIDMPEEKKRIYAIYAVGGATAVERDKYYNGVEDFATENKYYTDMLDAIEKALFGRIIIKR